VCLELDRNLDFVLVVIFCLVGGASSDEDDLGGGVDFNSVEIDGDTSEGLDCGLIGIFFLLAGSKTKLIRGVPWER